MGYAIDTHRLNSQRLDSVRRAIHRRLLDARIREDRRWHAAIVLGDLAVERPAVAWPLIAEFARSQIDDVRMAIACCVLEHLLEYHFADYFPLIEREATRDSLFADTFRSCWKFGQSELPQNCDRLDALQAACRG